MSETALQLEHPDRQRAYVWLLAFVAVLAASATFISSCGGSAPGGTSGALPSEITFTISPSSVTVQAGQTQQFTASVTGTGGQTVQWYVNGNFGGNAGVEMPPTGGTISQTGLYTAPAIPPKPNTVSVSAYCLCSGATTYLSATAAVTLSPGFTEFSTLPDQIDTNLAEFLVSGFTNAGDTVTVNGTSVSGDSVGNFAVLAPLSPGPNRLELDVNSPQSGTQTFVKTITFDPNFSTASTRLLYVSSIAPDLQGTVVIDVDNNVLLGFIPNKHVRGISPDGKQIYMDDRSVISTATNQELPPPASPLAFSEPIPSDGFLVSPDGTRLYSRDEVLNVATNQLLANKLPASIESGDSYAGPNQGGPAITPDGKTIYFGSQGDDLFAYGAIGKIDTISNSATGTGIQPSNDYLSDITVTPDGKYLLVSSYSYATGVGDIFDAQSYHKLAGIPLQSNALQFNFDESSGDFAGQIVISSDSTKAIFGSAGNPGFQGGGVTVVDLPSFKVDAQVLFDLADHLAISGLNQLFVSSGDTPGIDVFALQPDGTLLLQSQFVLGINQFVFGSAPQNNQAYGSPRNDDIEKIVFKP